MTRLGRKPTGTKLLDKFTASPRALARMRAILETVSGEKTIPEACAELELGEAMFHRIRAEALAAALEALEPNRWADRARRPPRSRPPRPHSNRRTRT